MASSRLLISGTKRPIRDLSGGGSLLPSASADVHSSDDAIVFEGTTR